MDEIFFVDLPEQNVRETILRIHLTKRKLDPAQFSIAKIAVASDGFSGAEIEQALVAAIYMALSENVPVTTEHVLKEIKLTKPLSVLMGEKIAGLRKWALGRTVSASGEKLSV
jgi:SpoVK/Ycf46/Vps4 family AAA+-type ATPase